MPDRYWLRDILTSVYFIFNISTFANIATLRIMFQTMLRELLYSYLSTKHFNTSSYAYNSLISQLAVHTNNNHSTLLCPALSGGNTMLYRTLLLSFIKSLVPPCGDSVYSNNEVFWNYLLRKHTPIAHHTSIEGRSVLPSRYVPLLRYVPQTAVGLHLAFGQHWSLWDLNALPMLYYFLYIWIKDATDNY
mgnify:CR=1 FL=1